MEKKEEKYYDVPKEELRTGVVFKRVYETKRPPRQKGKPPAWNKIIPLVE